MELHHHSFFCKVLITQLDLIVTFFLFAGRKSHLRKTFHKIAPAPETIAKIQDSEIWKMENEFYLFAKEQFHFIKKRTFEYKDGYMQERKQQFSYEKIRPR